MVIVDTNSGVIATWPTPTNLCFFQVRPCRDWFKDGEVGRSGPCGYNARVGVDYNQPAAHWGNSVVATYTSGVIATWPTPTNLCFFQVRPCRDWFKDGAFGAGIVATYTGNQIVEVEWCVDNNGDHGGMFTYGICQNHRSVQEHLCISVLPPGNSLRQLVSRHWLEGNWEPNTS
jgi:hypothetical protein